MIGPDALYDLGWHGAVVSTRAAYWTRELTPGWPPAIHPLPAATDGPEMIQIPVDRLQLIGIVLGLAILCLTAVTLAIARKAKSRKRS